MGLPKRSEPFAEMNEAGGPWVMGPVMANAVRRTNAMLNMVPDLEYYEAMLASSDTGMTALGNVAVGTSMYMPFMTGFWQMCGAIPQPGSGPSAEEMDKGFLTLT